MRLWEIETEDKGTSWDNTFSRYKISALTFKSAISKTNKLMSKYERIKSVNYQGKLDT